MGINVHAFSHVFVMEFFEAVKPFFILIVLIN